MQFIKKFKKAMDWIVVDEGDQMAHGSFLEQSISLLSKRNG